MSRSSGVLSLVALAALSAPASVGGQAGPTQSQALVLERETNDRWIHEAQHADFVPFETVREPFHLRATRYGQTSLARGLRFDLGGVRARLSLDDRNHLNNGSFGTRDLDVRGYDDERARADARRRRLIGRGATLNLPAARYWEVPFPLPGRPLTIGLTWTDTLSFLADPGEGLSETLDGTWDFRVTGDTLVDGRSLVLVHSEARVRYASVDVMLDPSDERPLTVERHVTGSIRGWAAVDTLVGVRALGSDTASWSGTASLLLQDGRSLPSRVRYERTRSWALTDSTDWAAREDARQAERRSRSTGMLSFPEGPAEERLNSGDPLVLDSVIEAWRSATGVKERLDIELLILRWLPGNAAAGRVGERTVTELRREAGDTVFAIARSLAAYRPSPGFTVQAVDSILPYLDDLGSLWKLGILPGYHYNQLASHLLWATPTLQPDTARWSCEPTACARLRDGARLATEPRLRDVGLVGDFANDPPRHSARLSARSDSGSRIVRGALELALGMGGTRPVDGKVPVPPPDAEWRAWLDWLGGSTYFTAQHRAALSMHRATTGRDAVDELRLAWPPDTDSARLVVGLILRGTDALGRPTLEELADDLQSGSPARMRAAEAELEWVVDASSTVAPPGLAVELLMPSLDSALTRGSFHGIGDVPVFVMDEGLPAGLLEALGDRVQVIDSVAWRERPRREGGVLLTIDPVRTNGPFARLSWSWMVYRRRAPDEAPMGYAGGLSSWLLRTENGWIAVRSGSWIT